MRTRLSNKQKIAKDLSFIKEGGELWWTGDDGDKAQWVTVVAIPDGEINIDDDSVVVCVNRLGEEFECFPDELMASNPKGESLEDYGIVARQLRRAAKNYMMKKIASVKVAKRDDNDKDVYTVDMWNESKEYSLESDPVVTKIYYDADEAIEAAEGLLKEYMDEDDEWIVSVLAGEYEKPSGDILGEPTEIWSKSNKGGKKTASVKVAAEDDDTADDNDDDILNEDNEESTDELKVVTFKTSDKALVDLLKGDFTDITITTDDDEETFGPESFGDLKVSDVKESDKTASIRRRLTAAELDVAAVPAADEDTVNQMRNWLLKQGQFKSCIDTLTNEIATNAVYDLLTGKKTDNPTNGTEAYAFDWASRLLRSQFTSQIGKFKGQSVETQVEPPAIPEVSEPVEEIEVAASRTASRNRIASADRELANQLPHGSGIDYDWSFEKVGPDTVKAENAWHYMNANGYYVGPIPFSMVLKTDGTFDGPEFVSVGELAKTDFGKEIAFDVISNGLSAKEAEEKGLYDSATGEPNYDAVSDEDIKSTLESEIKDLGDVVWESFGETNQKALGAAVKAFLTDK